MPVAPARSSCPAAFRAAVFDMDGLLLDTEPLWHDAERELLERHGDTFSDADLEASHGRALVDTAAVYAERLGLPADAIERRDRRDHAGPLRRRGAAARGCPGAGGRAGRAGSRWRWRRTPSADLVRQALDAVGLRRSGWSCPGQDLGQPKPAPDVYLAACRALGVAPAEAIAFEDSPMGVQSALAAGLFVVGVPERPDVDLAGGRGAPRAGVPGAR